MIKGYHRRVYSRRAILATTLVVLGFVSAEIGTRAGWLEPFEHTFYDLWHNLDGIRAQPRHTVIVSVDDQALLDHRDVPLVFWGSYFARVIEVSRRAGAKIIGLDYLFNASAESWLRKLDLPGGDKSRTYDIPLRAQLATGQVVLAGTVTAIDQGRGALILPVDDYLFVLPSGLADVGLSNFNPDSDGVVRRFRPALFDDGTIPRLTFATLLAVKTAHLDPQNEGWLLGGQRVFNTPLPRTIGFVGPPGTIPRLSFGRFLNPDADTDPDIQGLAGKVVIIAAEHSGMQDIHMTPYGYGLFGKEGILMSGAELHANIVETLLTGRFPRPIPEWFRLSWLLAAAILGTILFLRLDPWRGLGFCLLLCLVSTVSGLLFFLIDSVLPVTPVYVTLGLSYLGILGFRLTGEERERARLRRMFGQYVSDEVVEELLTTGRRPDLGGELLEVTVLFADIRNFTQMSERLGAHQVVEMLNVYLSRVTEPILEQGGTVDKFVGDAVMAVFGSPVRMRDHARHAVRAALGMAAIAREFRVWMHERFADLDLPEFSIGVGLHTGDAVVGNIGSPKRKDFTAIGDTVNTASRLEEMSKELGWTVVASETTVAAANPGVLTGRKEEVSIRGRNEKAEVFEVIGLEPEGGGEP